MAVRIDIRPRLTLRDERAAPRRRFQLPPLAVPAVGYWLGMAALTYFFATLGEAPIELPLAAAAEPPGAVHESPPRADPPLPSPRLPDPPPLVTLPQPLAHETETEVPTPSETETETTDSPLRAASDPEKKRERVEPGAPPAPAPLARWDEPAKRLTFPEFTDSSAPPRRERAGDGPRIEGLFERRADEAPHAPPPSPPAAAPDSQREAPALSSCEAAVARNNETIELGAPRGPADITREAYASILQNGSYLSGCKIPDRTVFEICAAVRDGRAMGVTVTSSPPSASLNACVRRAVAGLKFPTNPRLDVTHTRFDAARR